jgi:predicted DNA-binding transcriptional regulator AlpA
MPVIRQEQLIGGKELLRAREVAQRLGLGARTVWRLSRLGQLPAPVRFGPGGRIVRWKATEIARYVAKLRRGV